MIGECLVSCYALQFHILPKSSDIRTSGAALFSVQFSVQAGGIEANRCVDDGIVWNCYNLCGQVNGMLRCVKYSTITGYNDSPDMIYDDII